ncbi:MAG: hypothetical protein HY402_04425 [Elusimicrobia bacterium]|nr:hypothetical protein [Elusimicrobiota bacterium]
MAEIHSAQKPFEEDDPMELVGVALPEGQADEMLKCLIEEYIREGFDDEGLLRLFRDPFYRASHRIYQEKGEAYVLDLIERLRQKWGFWKGSDASARLRMDEVKKQMLKNIKEERGNGSRGL